MKEYQKIATQPMRPYIPGEDLFGISVSSEDTPEKGGMIAVNPDNPDDKWYVAKKFFEENYAEVSEEKSLGNTDVNGTRKNVSDVVVFGNGDMFQLLCKASSKKQGWMKSTKAMQCGDGCVIQVTTQQRNPDGGYVIAEALTYAPDTEIQETKDGNGVVVGRELV